MSSAAVAPTYNLANYRNLAAAVLGGAREEFIACRLFLMYADKTWHKYGRKAYRRFLAKGRATRDGQRRPPNSQERAAYRAELRAFRAQAIRRAESIVEQNAEVLFSPTLWSAWVGLQPESVKAALLTDEQVRAHARAANIRPMSWATLAESRL